MDHTVTRALMLLREIKSVTFATVNQGRPVARIIDVAHIDDDGLYFITARGKPFYDQLIELLFETAAIQPVLKPPIGVEVSIREGQSKKLVFIVNHMETQKVVKIPSGKFELLREEKTGNEIKLGPYEVAVIQL